MGKRCPQDAEFLAMYALYALAALLAGVAASVPRPAPRPWRIDRGAPVTLAVAAAGFVVSRMLFGMYCAR